MRSRKNFLLDAWNGQASVWLYVVISGCLLNLAASATPPLLSPSGKFKQSGCQKPEALPAKINPKTLARATRERTP